MATTHTTDEAMRVRSEPTGPRGVDEPQKLPAHLVYALQLAEVNIKLAEAARDKLALQIERDMRFRFEDVVVQQDGTLTPRQ